MAYRGKHQAARQRAASRAFGEPDDAYKLAHEKLVLELKARRNPPKNPWALAHWILRRRGA